MYTVHYGDLNPTPTLGAAYSLAAPTPRGLGSPASAAQATSSATLIWPGAASSNSGQRSLGRIGEQSAFFWLLSGLRVLAVAD